MTHEFQVAYRDVKSTEHIPSTSGEGITVGFENPFPVGPVLTVPFICEGPDQARAQFTAAGLFVVAVNHVRAVVDWSKPVFDRDELAAYIGLSPGRVSQIKGGGELPMSEVNGRTVYVRAWLEKLLEKNANEAGKQMAKECRRAA